MTQIPIWVIREIRGKNSLRVATIWINAKRRGKRGLEALKRYFCPHFSAFCLFLNKKGFPLRTLVLKRQVIFSTHLTFFWPRLTMGWTSLAFR